MFIENATLEVIEKVKKDGTAYKVLQVKVNGYLVLESYAMDLTLSIIELAQNAKK